ncbi:MAG: helix-turn-helix domain-containing protein [Xanthobacteraceae bacterium]
MARALNSFGMQSRQIRSALGKTMADQAVALSMRPVEISEIESGLRLPSKDYVDRFSRWLNLDDSVKQCLKARIPTATIIQFPKASSASSSVRLFRRVSNLSPQQIREIKSKESLE